MIFLNKYEMIGDGEGDNVVLSQITGRNVLKEAPTFLIPNSSHDMSTFWLHLEHPDVEHDDKSFFIKESHEKKWMYRLTSEDMLENEEFKSCILGMIKDIAPQRLEEVRQQIA